MAGLLAILRYHAFRPLGLPLDVALLEIKVGAGSQFDPDVVATLLDVLEDKPTRHEQTQAKREAESSTPAERQHA